MCVSLCCQHGSVHRYNLLPQHNALAGFHTVRGGLIPSMNLTWADIPHQLEFVSGFENLITFKCKFKAFRSRIKHFVLKTHKGDYFHFRPHLFYSLHYGSAGKVFGKTGKKNSRRPFYDEVFLSADQWSRIGVYFIPDGLVFNQIYQIYPFFNQIYKIYHKIMILFQFLLFLTLFQNISKYGDFFYSPLTFLTYLHVTKMKRKKNKIWWFYFYSRPSHRVLGQKNP
jgi:hypothetical protein